MRSGSLVFTHASLYPVPREAYRDGADCICLNSLSRGRKTQCSGIPAVIELVEPLLCYTVH